MRHVLAASLLATTMLSLPSTAHAQAMSADEAAALRAELDALKAKVQTLEARLDAATTPSAPAPAPVIAAPAPAAPSVTAKPATEIAWKGAPELKTADGWSFKPRGRLQVDVASIDAPELRQAWGRQAREHLATLCLRQRAEVQALGRDKYQRTLAQVRCRGRDAALEQANAGLAWVHPSQVRAWPQVAAAAARARRDRRGLWSQKRPLAPWKYRQRHSNAGGV